MTNSNSAQSSADRRSTFRAIRYLFLAAASAAALLLAACGDDDDDGGEASASGEEITITNVNPYSGHPFTTSVECGAQREAEKLGVELNLTGANKYTVPNVTQALNAVAADQPDGVIVPIWDPVAFSNAIRSLTSAGAVAIGVNGEPEDPSLVSSYIRSDDHEGGVLAAKEMLTKVKSGDTVLVLENNPTNLVSRARREGFQEEMEAAGVEVLNEYTEEDVTKTTSIVQATLAKEPDLAGIYTTTGTDGPPALKVLQQQGLTDQVSVIEYDGSPEQVERVKDGSILAAVAQRPDVEGQLAVRYIVNELNGEDVPESDLSPVGIVTQDNVDDPETQEILYQEC